MPTFWLYQGSEYTTTLNMLLVLNIRRLLIYRDYRRFWIYLRICMLIIKYVWICWNVYEYIYICLNGFCFLKEPWTVFLKGQYLIFSKVAESIWFVFSFRLNIFANNNLDVAIVDFPYFVASSGLIRDSQRL